MDHLPLLNAILNSIATVLLVTGLALIKKKRVAAHRRTMIAAFGVSCAFLVSYLLHKVTRGHTPFHGEGAVRTIYFVILATHVTLAATVPVLALRLIYLGLKGRIEGHKRLAKIAWPIWFYVSVTGVVIYLMLYPFNPAR